MPSLDEALKVRCIRLKKLARGNVAVAVLTPDPDHAARLIDHAAEQLMRAREIELA